MRIATYTIIYPTGRADLVDIEATDEAATAYAQAIGVVAIRRSSSGRHVWGDPNAKGNLNYR